MPAWIKTKADEDRWEKAKGLAKEQGKADNWAYVTSIYKSLNGGKVAMPSPARVAEGWARMPKGWTRDSLESFWDELTGDVKHKVTKCIKEMGDKMDNPGAFCAATADEVDPGWRKRAGVRTAGLARHWKIIRQFEDDEWGRLLGQVRSILSTTAADIKGPAGRGLPVARRGMIALNGDLSQGQTGEAFTMMPIGAGTWEACKTYGLPYDAVVQGILLAARAIAPDAIQLVSDAGLPARVASAHARRLAARVHKACIIAVGEWGGHRCLVKNRDRNYKPKLQIVHALQDGTEVLYVKDLKTGWVEGFNEHGIGIVNSALLVGRDETEREIVVTVGKKLKDGERILKALGSETVNAAVESIKDYEGGLTGHTFVSSPDESWSIELTSRHDGVERKLRSDCLHVRTNHGFEYDDAGYTEGPSYVSSVARRDNAKKVLRQVEDPYDVGPALWGRRDDPKDPNNMVRSTGTGEDNMNTTSQLVIDLDDKTAILWLVKGQATLDGVENKLPKGREPKLKIKVRQYDKDGRHKALKVPA